MPGTVGWRFRSLRARLAGLWAMFLVAAVAAGWIILGLWRESAAEQVARAEAGIARDCAAIADRYRSGPRERDLTAVAVAALQAAQGVEGGIWQVRQGSLAYAYPTYEGSGRKTDLSAAEEQRIREITVAAATDGAPVARRY